MRLLPVLAVCLTLAGSGVSVLADPDAPCCVGRVGDVNGSGGDEPTIGDINRLIELLFIYVDQPIECIEEADVNGSGGSSPTESDITVGDISRLIDYLFVTGSSIGLPLCPDASGQPVGYFYTGSDCKSSFAALSTDAAADQGCLQWDYNQGRLTLTHQNAGFNCCSIIDGTVTIDGDEITIEESETGAMCDCLCLYDLEFIIDNLPADTYTITVIEPYLNESDPPMSFRINLEYQSSGLRCLPRLYYPWNSEPLSGYVVGHSSCKSHSVAAKPGTDPAATADPSNDETCVVYSYDASTGLLSFTHVNAAFNCCPDQITADFSVEGNTITVTEDEVLVNPCLCLCLYDVECVVTDLSPGTYELVIEEKYTADGPPLAVSLDLTESVTGVTVCVPRDGYPWGEEM